MRALDGLARAFTGLTSRSLENPGTPLRLSDVTAASDLWSHGTAVGRVGTAIRCEALIASSVAGCPLRVTEHRGPRDVVPRSHPALELARARWSGDGLPAARRVPRLTPLERDELAVSSMLNRGNAFFYKVRQAGTDDPLRIIELVYIDPRRVRVTLEDGAFAGAGPVKRFTVDGGKLELTEREVLHIPAKLGEDGVTGLGIVEHARRIFDLAGAAEAAAHRFYSQGLMSAGFLTTDADLTEEQATTLKARWQARSHGLSAAHEISVLDNGARFEPLAMKPSDAQFLESRKFQTTEIARLYGVPGWLVNDQEKSTSWGTGMEAMFTAFVMTTLKPYMQRIEQRITRELLPEGWKAEYKVEGLLRGDSKARAAYYASGITHGWLTPNEPRELEDLPPVAWGDEPYLPHNTSASAQGGDRDQQGEED